MAEEEDDVEFLYEMPPLECQLCQTSLHTLSPEQRQAHYDRHFTDEPQASGSGIGRPFSTHNTPAKAPVDSNPRTLRMSKGVPVAKQDIFWTQAHLTTPPDNFTPGLIHTLKRALLKTHAKGVTTRAMLCHEGVTHVSSEDWDRGWGCGYRNFLMVSTALVSQTCQPLYFPLLDDPTPPGVRNLQMWIEDAWADGFDREGAKQLKHKLVGTKKWIGAADLYVAFISRGIPARLVDFPGSDKGPRAITEWIINYFSPLVREERRINAFDTLKGASPVLCTERMPLILQHSGHSRTVVGVEVSKRGGINLLIFDPSNRPGAKLRRTALANYPSLCSSSKSKNETPSGLYRFLHSRNDEHRGRDRKRRASSRTPGEDVPQAKRVRGSPQHTVIDKVLTISDDSDGDGSASPDLDTLDPVTVAEFFRVNESKLGKKVKYQILWFPLDPPLKTNERWARRVVTSELVV